MADKKEHKRLTIAELKNFNGFENYTDEQAEETIRSLEKLSIFFYKLYMKQKEAKEINLAEDSLKEKRTGKRNNSKVIKKDDHEEGTKHHAA